MQRNSSSRVAVQKPLPGKPISEILAPRSTQRLVCILAKALLALSLLPVSQVHSQVWQKLAQKPFLNHPLVTVSANGEKLVWAPRDGSIYTSTNYGATWKTPGSPSADWTSIASSENGETIVAASHAFGIFVTKNGGQRWTRTSAPRGPVRGWTAVVCSANGQMLAAASADFADTAIYTSSDSGLSWIRQDAPQKRWTSLATSHDGMRLIAASADGGCCQGQIYTSDNAGLTWTRSNPNSLQGSWRSVSSSSDGRILLAAAEHLLAIAPGTNTPPGGLCISTNFGENWKLLTNSGRGSWTMTSMTANGSILFASQGSAIFSSRDLGMSWTTNQIASSCFLSLASSATGAQGIAAAEDCTDSLNVYRPGGLWVLQAGISGEDMVLPGIAAERAAVGSVRVSFDLPASKEAFLESSEDLRNWTVIEALASSGSRVQRTFQATGSGWKFFRVRLGNN